MTQTPHDTEVSRVVNAYGAHPIVLVCEHASAHIPTAFDDLGLDATARHSHIAWDPGALATAQDMSRLLDAPLIHATVSRLVYDCNRPPEAPSAMPAQSEATVIPGNADLDAAARAHRIDTYYRPWERALSDLLAARPVPPVMVTMHSFTPTFHGQTRSVEIGVLHDSDTRLADALLDDPLQSEVARNQPYGPEDGVTHTLRRHAIPKGWLNVMIEVRNDLVATPEDCAAMAQLLTGWLDTALTRLSHPEVPR